MTTLQIDKKFKDNKFNMEVVVDKNLQDHGSDPAIQKKAEKAVAFLKKNGVPKSIAKKNK